MVEELTLMAATWQCLVDRGRGNTKDRARDGAGRLVEHANRQCDVAINSSWPAAAGPDICDLWYS